MDPALITLIIALAGAAGSVLSFIAGRKEQQASVVEHVSSSYRNLVLSLEERVNNLEEENKELTEQIGELKKENQILRKEVEQLEKDKGSLTARVTLLERNGGLT